VQTYTGEKALIAAALFPPCYRNFSSRKKINSFLDPHYAEFIVSRSRQGYASVVWQQMSGVQKFRKEMCWKIVLLNYYWDT